jgi:ribonuclease BN (tRNA processing enzyme)
VRITVLGKSPAFQDVNGACSGYLVEGGGKKILLDCGPGVFAKLRTHTAYHEIDAVVISHLHADHVIDLVTFASALRYGAHPAKPRLIAPPGAKAVLTALCAGGSMRGDHIEGVFELTTYDPADTIALGEIETTFRPVPHYIPCNAVQFAHNGQRITYGADCGPNESLVDFAKDTDLLIAEATLPEPDDEGHLTPFQAGEHGAKAKAKRLMLTHYSDELDPAWVQSEGERGFGRSVILAAEGLTLDLDDRAPSLQP